MIPELNAEGVALLRAVEALEPEWIRLREQVGVDAAGQDAAMLANMTALWPAFDTSRLLEQSSRLRRQEVCPSCGGWLTQPVWAIGRFERSVTANLYGSPGAQTPGACTRCSPGVPPAHSFEDLAHADTCEVCRGLGLVPNWQFNFVSMPCMAGGQVTHAGMWFPVACGGCGGWGKQRQPKEQQTAGALNTGRQSDVAEMMSFDGTRWWFSFDGRSMTFADSVGLRHLDRLVSAPNRSISCLDLSAMENGLPATSSAVSGREELGIGKGTGEAGAMIDVKAIGAYRSRLLDLDTEIGLAEEQCDLGRQSSLKQEREMLLQELGAATTRSGMPRRFADDAERARKAVSKAVRTALKRIGETDPGLRAHLEASVKLGRCCVFAPATSAT